MTRLTPTVQETTLSYNDKGQKITIVVGSAQWFEWLNKETSIIFTFHSIHGSYTARKERAGNRRGGWYWKAYRKYQGMLYRAYLGISEDMAGTRLCEIALKLSARIHGQTSDDPCAVLSRGEQPSPYWNLPPLETAYFGHEREIAQLLSFLHAAETRLLTLTGPGGVGKTRLALHVAELVRTQFSSGVCLVSLAPCADAPQVLVAIAQALAISERSNTPLLERVEYSLKQKKLLLILDTFEHVLSASSLLADLLSCCPYVVFLVTSRSALQLPGEHEICVSPLACPPLLPKQLSYEEATQYAAMALFLDRVQIVHPSLPISSAEIKAIAQICQRLDGLPLALELAAARCALFKPQIVVKQLDQWQHFLVDSGAFSEGQNKRQHTLWLTIEWSYELLTIEEQILFQMLCVFPGGCSLQALESLRSIVPFHTLPGLNGITSLCNKSLIYMEESDGEIYICMLKTIREYGLHHLQEIKEQKTLFFQAYARYYLELVERIEPALSGAEQTHWHDYLDREYDNIRVALNWFTEHDHTLALRLAGALTHFWSLRGCLDEGREHLRTLLLSSDSIEFPIRAKAMNGAGWLAILSEHTAQAESYCVESRHLYRILGDANGCAWTLQRSGLIALQRGALTQAETFLNESLALFRSVDDENGLGFTTLALFSLAYKQKAWERARVLLNESLALFRSVHNRGGMAWTLVNLGQLLLYQGNFTETHAILEESLRLFTDLKMKSGLAKVLTLSGHLCSKQGDSRRAEEYWTKSLVLFRELGYQSATGITLIHLGRNALAQGEPLRAQSFYRESLHIWISLGEQAHITACVAALERFTEVSHPPIRTQLTERELEVLHLITQGHTDTQIAQKLVVSPRTVNAHIRTIYRKIDVTSRASATRYALENHLL